MADLLITPLIGSDNNPNVVTLPATNVQAFYNDNFSLDTMSWYQSQFNVFRKMTMNRSRNFTLHKLDASGPMWQPFDACAAIPFQGGGSTSSEIQCCSLQMFVEWCLDEFLGTCFESEIDYSDPRAPRLTPKGEEVFNMFLNKRIGEAAQWLHYTALFGDLYGDDIPLSNEVGATQNKQFRIGANACRGVFAIWKQEAKNYPWLDLGLKDDLKFTDCGYDGSVVELIQDKLMCEANPKFKNILFTGSAGRSLTGTRDCNVFIFATPDFFPTINQEYIDQQKRTSFFDESKACIEKVYYGENVSDFYWRILGMPVIPLNELTEWDNQIEGKTNFIGITVSENLQMGSNFGPRLGEENEGVGFIFGQDTNPVSRTYLKVAGRGYAVMANAMADPKLAVGCFTFHPKKK